MFTGPFFSYGSSIGSVGSGGVTGPGFSIDNSIPRWVGTSGDQLDYSGILISDTDDILMRSPNQTYISIKRLATVSGAINPEFQVGDVSGGIEGPKLSLSYSDSLIPKTEIGFLQNSGQLTLLRSSTGSFLSGTFSGRVNPLISITDDSIEFSDSLNDDPADSILTRDGPGKLSAFVGPFLNRVFTAEPGALDLGPSTSVGFKQMPATPLPPTSGYLVYPKLGKFYYLDQFGIEKPISSEPVIVFEAGYRLSQNNGYLRTVDGIFTNLAPFTLPFDCTLFSVTLSCETAVNDWRVEIFEMPAPTPTAVYSCPSNQTLAVHEPLSVDFDKEALLGVYLRKGPGGNGSGVNIPVPKVQLFFIRR